MTTNTTARTVRILSCSPAEGQLRSVWGEDGELIVFDTQAIAVLDDGHGGAGAEYVHATFLVPGAVQGPDGMLPNRNYRDRAEAFCQRVEARGFIDLAHWVPVRRSSYEEREGYNLKCEADERRWAGY